MCELGDTGKSGIAAVTRSDNSFRRQLLQPIIRILDSGGMFYTNLDIRLQVWILLFSYLCREIFVSFLPFFLHWSTNLLLGMSSGKACKKAKRPRWGSGDPSSSLMWLKISLRQEVPSFLRMLELPRCAKKPSFGIITQDQQRNREKNFKPREAIISQVFRRTGPSPISHGRFPRPRSKTTRLACPFHSLWAITFLLRPKKMHGNPVHLSLVNLLSSSKAGARARQSCMQPFGNLKTPVFSELSHSHFSA